MTAHTEGEGHGYGVDTKKDMAVIVKMKDGESSDEEGHAAKGTKNGDWTPSHGLTQAEAEELMKKWGRNELVEKTTPSWLIFLQQLYAPMPIMIWIAVVIEAAIQNWIDMGILLGIQFCNATIGWYEITKAGNAVAALKASLKPQATVKRDGQWKTMDAALLVPGDLVLLASGSAVPADTRVNHGQIQVDQAALTGESLPVTFYPGDDAKMGSTVVRGETEGTVMETGMNTFFGKTASMLQQGDDLGNLQKILLRIMFVLVALSLLLCGIALIYLVVGRKINFKEALSFVVVLLVASIPIAIEIVCTATLALGSRQLSHHGAIVTRLTSIEEMAGMNMLCSDKTGTLTLNKMVIQEDTPIFTPGETQKTILQTAALAAKWREPARDALDTLVLGAADLSALDMYRQVDFMPFDPTVKRTEATLECPDGRVFKTTKGAPQAILKICWNQDQIHDAVWAKVNELAGRGIRSLAVAKTDEQGRWNMLGMLTFLDPPRHDTKETIEKALAQGVDVKMITGDHAIIAKETARALGMGQNIPNAKGLPTLDADGKVPQGCEKFAPMIIEADGFAEVFPEHKFMIVEVLRKAGFAVGMTGDGVNDAPALKRADVGIAVSGATDAARAAADMVLTQEGLSVIIHAIIIARCIFKRIQNFINYRIAATLQLLVFFFIAVFAFTPEHYSDAANIQPAWPEFFSLPVLMLMLITLLNDGTLISIGYDHVKPSERPEKWNLRVLFLISVVLGGVALASSLLFIWGALDSNNPNGMFRKLGLPAMPYGEIICAMYLKVSLSDFLTLFSARTTGFFWTARPGYLLLGAAGAALSLSTILACVWPSGHTDGIPTQGLGRGEYKLWALWLWIYCLVFFLVQDACKVLTYMVVLKYDIFQARTCALVNLREAHHIDDADRPMARASVGAVENKILARKVDSAVNVLSRAEQQDKNNPAYKEIKENLLAVHREASQGLTEARKSSSSAVLPRASLAARPSAAASQGQARASAGRASTSVEAGTAVHPVVAAIDQAARAVNPHMAPALNAAVDEVLQAADRLAEVSALAGVDLTDPERRPSANSTFAQ